MIQSAGRMKPAGPAFADVAMYSGPLSGDPPPPTLLEYRHHLWFFRSSCVVLAGEGQAPEPLRTAEAESALGIDPDSEIRIHSLAADNGVVCRLAYVSFLDTASQLLPYFEARRIPFVFQLYPGGGFEPSLSDADERLDAVVLSPLCRRVIATELTTRDYLLKQSGCPAAKIELVYGGVYEPPLGFDFAGHKFRYPDSKATLDICFVSEREDRGSRQRLQEFIRIGGALVMEDPRLHCHVVGAFAPEETAAAAATGRFTFHGRLSPELFADFYRRMDAILSVGPPDAGESFPPRPCVEAGLRGIVNCLQDPRGMNAAFRDGEGVVLLSGDAGEAVQRLRGLLADPDRLYDVAATGLLRFHEVFDLNRQLWARTKVIADELSHDERVVLRPSAPSSRLDVAPVVADASEQRTAIQELERTAEHWRTTLASVYGSWSWQLTGPFRVGLRAAALAKTKARGIPRRGRYRLARLARRHAPGWLARRLEGPGVRLRDRTPPGRHVFAGNVEIRRGEVGRRSQIVADAIQHPPSIRSPLASIVITCYNYARLVEEAVASAQAQTLPDVEIIVVDDESTDPLTVNALAKLEQAGVRVVRQRNMGGAMARNNGTALASGKYICCLDHDDTLEPTYLEKAVIVMEARSDIGVVYPYLHFFGDEDWVWEAGSYDFDVMAAGNQVCSAAVFRRDFWAAAGGWCPAVPGYVDWEFWLRLCSLGVGGRLLREPLVNNRRHGRTMLHDAREREADEIRIVRDLDPEAFDAAFRERVSRGLKSVRSPEPFAWLSLANARARDRGEGILVLAGVLSESAVSQLLLALLWMGGVERVKLVTTLAADRFKRIDAAGAGVYSLPALVDPSEDEDFVLAAMAPWNVGSVLIAGSDLGYALAEKLKSRGAAVNDLLLDGSWSGIQRSARHDRALDRHLVVTSAAEARLIDAGIDRSRIERLRPEHGFRPTTAIDRA